MASMATAARGILATSPRDTLTGVAARSVPVTRPPPLPLPTPPNSISPALPPHGLRAQLLKAKLEPVDSDLDLLDNQDHGSSDDRTATSSPQFDSTGNITSALLAKFHLPEILLSHGPLAIRHIMGYLTTSVPGFAGLPPAKARRLVVGALEGRGAGGDGGGGGGVEGDVEFEKVGWGRWDARRAGQPPRDPHARRPSPTGAASPYPHGIPIAKHSGWPADRGGARLHSGSSAGDSAAFSHDDRDITMLEHEADKMSFDGSGSASYSPAPDEDVAMGGDDPDDATDDEDWAAVGAAALRAGSYSNRSATRFGAKTSRVYTSGGGLRSVSYHVGRARPPPQQATLGFNFSAFGGTSDAQERDAVEALLRLGSV